MLWDERKPSHAALMPAESVMAPVGLGALQDVSLGPQGSGGYSPQLTIMCDYMIIVYHKLLLFH
mgnify:CR=1 FL=1